MEIGGSSLTCFCQTQALVTWLFRIVDGAAQARSFGIQGIDHR
jgi:hypothetical protein